MWSICLFCVLFCCMGLPSHEATKVDSMAVALQGNLIFTLPLDSDVYSLCLTK